MNPPLTIFVLDTIKNLKMAARPLPDVLETSKSSSIVDPSSECVNGPSLTERDLVHPVFHTKLVPSAIASSKVRF